MMPTVKEMLKVGNQAETIYQTKFDDYLRQWEKEKNADRSDHFHASSLTDKDFCLVKAVLDEMIPGTNEGFPPRILSVFQAGIDIHNKHQEFQRKSGMAIQIEQQYYSEFLEMTATPDSVIEFLNCRTITEIKSMNCFQFSKLSGPPANAYAQSQIYMYITALPQTLVIVEDKNTQALKVYKVEFNLEDALALIKRRRVIMRCMKHHVIPVSKRICEKKNQRKRCKFNDICFNLEYEIKKGNLKGAKLK